LLGYEAFIDIFCGVQVISGSDQPYGLGLKITEPIIKKPNKKAKDNETKSHYNEY